MGKVLIITDVQNDFCPGGALAVSEGDTIIPAINVLSPRFERVIATQDWHPARHVSFAQTHGRREYEVIKVDGIEQVLWPPHCVAGTSGAEFHKDLNTENVDLILRKGTRPLLDSYSVFLENDKKTETGLHYYLKGLQLQDVYLCGLTTDYCIFFSAMDAKDYGFNVFVILDACKGIDMPEGSLPAAVDTMRNAGVHLIYHDAIR